LPETGKNATGLGVSQIKITKLRDGRSLSLALFICGGVGALGNLPENFDCLIAR
jgi:hypothetical protein